MGVKIINIIPHPPNYELCLSEPRPAINWDTSDGKWVGIWGYDWADMVGKEVLKLTNEFEYEVWQPDLHADKTYSYNFKDGLKHILFPASNKNHLYGIKLANEVHSLAMLKELRTQLDGSQLTLILHLNGNIDGLAKKILSLINIPVIHSYHGVIHLPSSILFSHTKNIPSKCNNIIDHLWLKRNINKTDVITYQNDTNIGYLRNIYNGKLEKITMGCDFSFWYPTNRKLARKELGLPENQLILFCACNLIPNKQIDKAISVFSKLSERYDFLWIIAGHGTKEYEDYLHKLASDLLGKNKIKFVGYIRGRRLLQYYNACDLFLSASKEEGASVSAMQAFACGVPVISTKTGNTAELMEQYNCGCLMDIYDYDQWKKKLEGILQGQQIEPMDREVAREYYDWPNIASKFITIYHKLAK